ncbi:MAG: hypothetical protein Q9180_006063 [Flavoplaca navasiana]
MLVLVCALSVSARCVKRQATNNQAPVIQKAPVSQNTPQSGSRRKLLEESSAGSGNLTNTLPNSAEQGDQSSDQDVDGTSTSTSNDSDNDASNTQDIIPSGTPSGGPGDQSSVEGTSSTSGDDSDNDTSSTDDTTTTSADSGKDSSNDSSNDSSDDTSNGSDNGSSSTDNTSAERGSTNQTMSTEVLPSTGGGGGSGSCGSMKSVCFNSGMQPSMFDQMKSASHWITFGLDIPGGAPSPRAKQAHIPMMAFENHVADAVKLVNGPDAPEWLLTFNEPDHSYMFLTPTMNGAEAAKAIQPLLDQPGTKTKFVAPGPAFWTEPFLEEFFAACKCKDFFSAYNMHSYTAESERVIKDIEAYHSKWSDKPIWITELAPGGCGKSPETVGQFFKDVFKFSKDSGYVDKVMWNTGNQIDPKDTNVCDTWLVDGSGKPGPLLEIFESMDCS